MNITIRQQPLPGIGQRYEIDLSKTRRLVVVATPDGGRTMGVVASSADDVPMVDLSREQATMLGALLLGAHFSIDVAADPTVHGDTVIVDTVTIPCDAPSVDRRPSDILPEDPRSAQVLGIVRDRTPEILESDRDSPLRPGDQVALAARAIDMERVRRLFTG